MSNFDIKLKKGEGHLGCGSLSQVKKSCDVEVCVYDGYEEVNNDGVP